MGGCDAQALSRIKFRGVGGICGDNVVRDLRITGLNRAKGINILRQIQLGL